MAGDTAVNKKNAFLILTILFACGVAFALYVNYFGISVLAAIFTVYLFMVTFGLAMPDKYRSLIQQHERLIIYFTFFTCTFVTSFAGSTIAENHAFASHMNATAGIFPQIPKALDQTGVILLCFLPIVIVFAYLMDHHIIPSIVGYKFIRNQRIDQATGAVNISLRQETLLELLYAISSTNPNEHTLEQTANKIGTSFGSTLRSNSDNTINSDILSKWKEIDTKAGLFQAFTYTKQGETDSYILTISSPLLHNLCLKLSSKDTSDINSPCNKFLIPYISGTMSNFKNYKVTIGQCMRTGQACTVSITLIHTPTL